MMIMHYCVKCKKKKNIPSSVAIFNLSPVKPDGSYLTEYVTLSLFEKLDKADKYFFLFHVLFYNQATSVL